MRGRAASRLCICGHDLHLKFIFARKEDIAIIRWSHYCRKLYYGFIYGSIWGIFSCCKSILSRKRDPIRSNYMQMILRQKARQGIDLAGLLVHQRGNCEHSTFHSRLAGKNLRPWKILRTFESLLSCRALDSSAVKISPLFRSVLIIEAFVSP